MFCDLTVQTGGSGMHGLTGAGIEWTARWSNLLTSGVAVFQGLLCGLYSALGGRWLPGIS